MVLQEAWQSCHHHTYAGRRTRTLAGSLPHVCVECTQVRICKQVNCSCRKSDSRCLKLALHFINGETEDKGRKRRKRLEEDEKEIGPSTNVGTMWCTFLGFRVPGHYRKHRNFMLPHCRPVKGDTGHPVITPASSLPRVSMLQVFWSGYYLVVVGSNSFTPPMGYTCMTIA